MTTSIQTIALVADLHGNLPATLAVERDLRARGADAIWCLGDIVGKGPSSRDTMDWALENCQIVLRGNWDDGVARKLFARDGYYYDQLGEARMNALLALPLEHECWVSGLRVRLIHGRPVMPELLHATQEEALLAPYFQGDPPYNAVIYGDAHRSALRVLSCGYFANTGSVGNAIGQTGAHYLLMRGVPGREAAPFELSYVRLPYDVDQAVRDAEQSALHNRDAFIRELRTGVYSRGRDQRPLDKPSRTE